jgi:hypothetical protein
VDLAVPDERGEIARGALHRITRYAPALPGHIAGVVFGCADKEMIRPYTSPNVTAMTDEQSFGDGSICHLVRDFVRRFLLATDLEGTVAATASPA